MPAFRGFGIGGEIQKLSTVFPHHRPSACLCGNRGHLSSVNECLTEGYMLFPPIVHRQETGASGTEPGNNSLAGIG